MNWLLRLWVRFKVRPEDAVGISDDELTALVRAALEPGAAAG